MIIHFIRHATFFLEYNGLKILVDPMLGPEKSKDAVPNTPNPRRNPLVPLPIKSTELSDLIDSLDAVLISHTHGDHWDKAAQSILPKSLKIFCQPEDEEKIHSTEFSSVQPVLTKSQMAHLTLSRTGGQHGKGKIGQAMAPVSGFVLSSESEPTFYIAGDTVWCDEVNQAVKEHEPGVVIVNAGAAQFLEGGPITMTAQDVAQVCQSAPSAEIVAVHMEAINHCVLTRDDLRSSLESQGLTDRVKIPEDGEKIEL